MSTFTHFPYSSGSERSSQVDFFLTFLCKVEHLLTYNAEMRKDESMQEVEAYGGAFELI